ncbi:MAG: hypothetical protein A2Y62_15925 [Candidatus Fischerbacteria bacterium RBG_13_37_8]|uniref:Protein kinase domain-containing protein n=1 Tax=Candidatus Fischerbacteria bacterium RBG_13_37_8 TaxID=1817863 RepID=A0A1F5VV93_9BACT|nr:MAG: hypothetical protein A2Y62_15925 [Candidatus Fischerbacteria bacterium RBG_13_37_8]
MPLRKLNPLGPEELQTIVMKCLKRDPQRRYETARALAEDLGSFLEGEPILAHPTSTPIASPCDAMFKNDVQMQRNLLASDVYFEDKVMIWR